jgi:hypothetical protein
MSLTTTFADASTNTGSSQKYLGSGGVFLSVKLDLVIL